MTKKEFIDYWIKKLSSEGIKIFPDDFLENTKTTTIKIPPKTLIPGSELFGTYEVITTDSDFIINAENYTEAKYYVYSSLQRRTEIKFPKDKNTVPQLVKNYEQYIDSIIYEVSKDYKKNFSDSKESNPVSDILKAINLIRY